MIELAARAGRNEYVEILGYLRRTGIVRVDETGMQLDGEKAGIWMFRTAKDTLFTFRETRGNGVP